MRFTKKENKPIEDMDKPMGFQPLEPEISLDEIESALLTEIDKAAEFEKLVEIPEEMPEEVDCGFVVEPLNEKDIQEEKVEEMKGKTMTLKEKLKKLHQENDDMVHILEEKLLHIVSTTNATKAVLDFPVHKQEVVASYLKENDLCYSMSATEDVATFTISC